MRVCIASKFPPMEGGIAARTYWQVRHLLDEGHEVHVVTNAGCVEPEYRIQGCEEHLRELCADGQLQIHDLAQEVPWHVPMSPGYLDRLLSRLLGVLSESKFDFIESGYLVPYGIGGHIASLLTGVPHVVRHGGSDLAKFLPNPEYRDVLESVLRGAQHVITDDDSRDLVRDFGANIDVQPVYVPDAAAFKPASNRHAGPTPVCAYIGKINYHWRRKGLDQVVDWFARQKAGSVQLRVVGQGVGLDDFRGWTEARLGRQIEIEPFVPPWDMPSLLASVDALFSLSFEDPVRSWSMLAAEARSMGTQVVESLGA